MPGLSDLPAEVLVEIAGCFVLGFLVLGRSVRRVSGTYYNLFEREAIPDRVRRRRALGFPPKRPPGLVGNFARVYCVAVCQHPSVSQTRLWEILRPRHLPCEYQELPAIADGSDRGRESSGPPPLAEAAVAGKEAAVAGKDDDVVTHYNTARGSRQTLVMHPVVAGSHVPEETLWGVDDFSDDWVSIMGTPRVSEASYGDEPEEFGESDESEVDIFPYESEDGGRDGNGDGNDEESEESDLPPDIQSFLSDMSQRLDNPN